MWADRRRARSERLPSGRRSDADPPERPDRGGDGRPLTQGHRPGARGAGPGGRPRQGRRPPRPARSRRDGPHGGPRPSTVAAAQARVRDLEAGTRRSELAAAEADVNDRKAALDLAKKELQRQQFLLERKVGTGRDVDRAKTEVQRLEAALKGATSRLATLREGARPWQMQQAQDDVARAKTVLEQSRDRRERGRDPRAGRRRRDPSHRRAGPAAHARPARADAGVRRSPLRPHVRSRAAARQGPARHRRPTSSSTRFRDKTFEAKVTEISPRRRVHAEARRDARRARQPRLRREGRPRSAAGTSRSCPVSPPT